MKVLVIDDEPVHVRGIIKYVNWSKFGFDKVVGTFSAKEALKILPKEEFNLVVTDINMPEINGLELISRINLLGKHPDIMIVSGYNEFTYAQEAIRLGVCAYILKPVKPEEIEDNIRILEEKKKWEHLKKDNNTELDILNQIIGKENIIIGNDERKRIHPSIQKILIYIGKNYEKEISFQEIADEFHINDSYLSALFKKEIGINLSNYLQRYRLNRAMELLRNSDLRINEIANKVGYQNACYFTEQFKKVYNITPSEIRKECFR
jgi:Response regulator containing CheY-like receiver domain and AraC-type DNA-binding domain